MNPLKRKASLFFFSSLACFTWASSVCLSLPSKPVAYSGSVQVEYVGSHTMYIKASDNAILHYDDFQIGPGEQVRFIQRPGVCILHHVTGKNPSQILGDIHCEGTLVLVNPCGISVGENSTVETGSLILSALEATNADVSLFSLSQKKNSSILNEGTLLSQEGSIVLLAPEICNLGSIEAENGTVALGSTENATWNGESLSVQGCVEDALIEQRGSIQASAVVVKLPVRTQSITNQDESHEMFIETDGEIVFAKDSQIKAQTILVEGSHISIQGSVDATDALDQGGTVHLYGSDISLAGAKIDVSGLRGGGEVLIGGELQGKGIIPYAAKVHMDGTSEIYASATDSGDGGLVVLWSQEQTLFEGKISARGGELEGNGGLVETSSKGFLDVDLGKVDTLGPQGRLGDWLLDPVIVYIKNSGSTSISGCTGCSSNSSCTLNASVFKNLTSNVTVDSFAGYEISTDLYVTTAEGYSKASVTLHSCGNGGCYFHTPEGEYIYANVSYCAFFPPMTTVTTDGGSFTVQTSSKFTDVDLTINTNGGNISIGAMKCCYRKNGQGRSVTLNAGSGTVSAGSVVYTEWDDPSIYYYISGFTVYAGQMSASDLMVNGSISINAPMFINPGAQINATAGGANGSIALQSFDGSSLDSTKVVSMNAGTGKISFSGNIGSSTPINLGISSANTLSFTNPSSCSITSAGNAISFSVPTTFAASSINFNSQGASITLSSSTTFTGSNLDLTLNAGVGNVSTPALGSSLQSLNVTCGLLNIGGTLSASKNITFANTGAATINGAISVGDRFQCTGSGAFTAPGLTSTSGSIEFTGALILGGSSIWTAPAGITIGSQVSSDGGGSYDLTLDAGQSPISIGGDISNLHSFTVTSASEISLYNMAITGGAISVASPMILKSGGGVLSSGGGNISLSSTVRPSNQNIDTDLVMNATSSSGALGTISLQGAGDSSYPFRSISLTGSSITLGQTSTLIAANGPLYLSGSLGIFGNTVLKGSKGITLSGAMTLGSSNLDLTLDSGTYSLTIPSLGSSSTPLGNLNITASNLILGGDLYVSSSIQIGSPITISANTIFNSSGSGGITLLGSVTTSSGNPSLTLQSASGPLGIQSLGSSNSPLGAISLTGSYITLNGDINSASSMNLSGPITTTKSLTLSAVQGMTLNQDLIPNVGSLDLTLQATGGSVVAQNLGTDTNPLKNISILSAGSLTPKSLISTGDISLSGTTITLGSTMRASGTITIANTDLLTIPSGSMNLSGNFNQTGSGKVSLGMSLATSGSIGFAGDVTLIGSTTLQGSKGITITGTLAPSSGTPALTLDAGTNPLTVKFGCTSGNPFGAVSITASNLTMQGDIYSNTSILIDPSITISADTTLSSLSGYGGITLLGPVTTSSSNPNLTLQSVSGPLDIQSLGSSSYPLGVLSLTGSYITLNGDITSVASVNLSGSMTITKSLALTGMQGITVNQDLVPSTSPFDLTLQATGGTVVAQNLGTDAKPLKNISIFSAGPLTPKNLISQGNISLSGTTITLGATMKASGDITIANTDLLTIPSGSLNLSGNFNQTGSGKVSLGMSLVTSGSIGFTGDVTFTGSTTLQGSKGITISGTLAPSSGAPALTLDAGSNPLTVRFGATSNSPFGGVSVKASSLTLQGDLYSNTSISIDPSIIIAANTTFSSSGAGGITLLGPVTVSNGNPILTLLATAGPLNIQSLGSSSSPLGTLSLTGSYLTLNGDLTSAASMNLSGSITTTKSLTLTGTQGITLNQDLVPSTSAFDLTLQAMGGSVVAQNLGTDAKPLKNISIFSAGPITPQSLISTGNISLSGTTITLGATMKAAGDITIANTDLLTIPSGSMSFSGNFSQTGSGNVALGMSMSTSGSIAFAGSVTITGSTILQGSKGVVITGTLAPSSGAPALTLDAGTNPLTVQFASSESNPFGALLITASNLIMQGDVYSNTSIAIDPSIMISSDTIFNSLSGYGGVLLLGPVTASNGTPSLTVLAVKGPADVDRLGSDDAPLGNVSITGGTYIHLGGDVVSVKSILVDGPTSITGSRTLKGSSGIVIQDDLTPSVAGLGLTLQTSNQVISTQNLGKSDLPMQTVSLICSTLDLKGSIKASVVTFNGETCSSGNWTSGTYTSCPASNP